MIKIEYLAEAEDEQVIDAVCDDLVLEIRQAPYGRCACGRPLDGLRVLNRHCFDCRSDPALWTGRS